MSSIKWALKTVLLINIILLTTLSTGCSQYTETFIGTVWELQESAGTNFPQRTDNSERYIFIAFNSEEYMHIDVQKKQDGSLFEEKTIKQSFSYKVSKNQLKLYETWKNYTLVGNILTLDYPHKDSKYKKTNAPSLEEITKYFNNKGKLTIK